MSWGHTHRDGTHHIHESEGCQEHLPAQLKVTVVDHDPVAGVSLVDWAVRSVESAPDHAILSGPADVFPDTTGTVKEAVAALELAGPDPAYSAGRVDFSEMLKTDAAWTIKHRLDDLLGRPYLSTQLAAMLPADVALRLVERAEAVIVLRTQANLDRLANEINRTTEATIDRLAKTANEKREELTRERFGRTTRLD